MFNIYFFRLYFEVNKQNHHKVLHKLKLIMDTTGKKDSLEVRTAALSPCLCMCMFSVEKLILVLVL